MKRTKFACCISMLVMLAVFCVGCGKSASDAGNMSASKNETEVSADTTVDEEVSGEDTAGDEAVEENVEESEPAFVIPDFDYDDYLTVSETDSTPVLGYNIPAGFQKHEGSSYNSVTFMRDGKQEQPIFVSYNTNANTTLAKIDSGSKTYIEQPSVDTPIGTFRVFNYDGGLNSNEEYAFLSITDTEGITVQIPYIHGVMEHYYEYNMKDLLNHLFGESNGATPIPEDYDYYLQSFSTPGQRVMGVKNIEGFDCNISSSFEDKPDSSINYSSHDTKGYYNAHIYITEASYLAPIYCEINNYDESFQETYTKKGECVTIYGTAKLFDVVDESGYYNEIALLRVNGNYVIIEYTHYDGTSTSNELESLLSQMF